MKPMKCNVPESNFILLAAIQILIQIVIYPSSNNKSNFGQSLKIPKSNITCMCIFIKIYIKGKFLWTKHTTITNLYIIGSKTLSDFQIILKDFYDMWKEFDLKERISYIYMIFRKFGKKIIIYWLLLIQIINDLKSI